MRLMANDRRALRGDIWAVVPIKETSFAKQRLSNGLPPDLRQELALAMFEDVLEALAGAPELAGIAIVTLDPVATDIACRWGAQVWTDGARDGHTGAIAAASHRLAAAGSTLLTIPGDVPLTTPADISAVINAQAPAPGFTIVPAWDERGSNTIICSPAAAVPLRFGADSFFPHLAAARACGLKPTIVRNDAIALDVDEPVDVAKFMERWSATRSWALLDRHRSKWNRALPVALAAQ
jgi:2-phospho-L-lactate/phosphoenolpyruvate guanylyltransferase